MLSITIAGGEYWDEAKEEFVYFGRDRQVLTLEHSLVSISKWEAKWKTPYLSKKTFTRKEAVDYIRCMTLTQNVAPDVYDRIAPDHINQVNAYINAPMTATTFSIRDKSRRKSEIITSELVYYWMILYGIPFDPCQKWHFNRLMTLIRICSIKNQSDKKMSNREVLNEHAALNAARRKAYRTG